MNQKPFFVIYGDNITNDNMTDLIDFHYKNNSDYTITMHTRDDFSQSGVLEFNDNSQVTQSIEKPQSKNSSKWVSSGVYVFFL